jgi:hypothetical protein
METILTAPFPVLAMASWAAAIGGDIFALLLRPGWALFVGLVAGAVGSAVREGFDEPLHR